VDIVNLRGKKMKKKLFLIIFLFGVSLGIEVFSTMFSTKSYASLPSDGCYVCSLDLCQSATGSGKRHCKCGVTGCETSGTDCEL